MSSPSEQENVPRGLESLTGGRRASLAGGRVDALSVWDARVKAEIGAGVDKLVAEEEASKAALADGYVPPDASSSSSQQVNWMGPRNTAPAVDYSAGAVLGDANPAAYRPDEDGAFRRWLSTERPTLAGIRNSAVTRHSDLAVSALDVAKDPNASFFARVGATQMAADQMTTAGHIAANMPVTNGDLLLAGAEALTVARGALRVVGELFGERRVASSLGDAGRAGAADYLSRFSSTELGALRTAGLSDVEIARHVELSGDIHLFRGTSPGWAGSPGAQATAVSATTDPYIATVFALEARGQAGQAVVQFGPRSSIGTFDVGNWMAAQEREVGVLMTSKDFAARAPSSVPVDTARQVLGEMGMPALPHTVASPSARSMLLDAAPKMTPEQVAEFIQRINKTGPR
jgi:hypothetical protein